jgi:hypothetical protein
MNFTSLNINACNCEISLISRSKLWLWKNWFKILNSIWIVQKAWFSKNWFFKTYGPGLPNLRAS